MLPHRLRRTKSDNTPEIHEKVNHSRALGIEAPMLNKNVGVVAILLAATAAVGCGSSSESGGQGGAGATGAGSGTTTSATSGGGMLATGGAAGVGGGTSAGGAGGAGPCAMDPNPGFIECDGELCQQGAQACCFNGGKACMTPGGACGLTEILCDETADCAAGEACCDLPATDGQAQWQARCMPVVPLPNGGAFGCGTNTGGVDYSRRCACDDECELGSCQLGVTTGSDAAHICTL
jgi:hypothetical protein